MAMLLSASLTEYVPKYVIVPSAVALFSSAVPCSGRFTAYLVRSERITVIMKRSPRSKKAMPLALAPYLGNLLPSGSTETWETRFQVPNSCSLSDFSWPTALLASKEIPNADKVEMATSLRRLIGVPLAIISGWCPDRRSRRGDRNNDFGTQLFAEVISSTYCAV